MPEGALISADSHFVEPPDLWTTRIDARFRDRAPHTVRGLDGRAGDFFVCEDVTPFSVAQFFAAGIPSAEMATHLKKTFDEAPAMIWDPAARLKDQDKDGVAAEVIYPSLGMPLFGVQDDALRAAAFRAYNDFATEYCGHNPKRLVALGLIALEDIPSAIKELQRVAKKGAKGALIWAEPPDNRPYSSPEYEPFWAAAQDLDLPLSLHRATASPHRPADPMGRLVQMGVSHDYMERSITRFVFGGVLEKFPKLRLVSAENNVGWLMYLMYRLDFVQGRASSFAGVGPKLRLRASEYITRQLYNCFISDPVFVDALPSWTRGVKVEGFAYEVEPYYLTYGVDNVMWSSDYPHAAATFPRSREIVASRFTNLTEAQRRKLVHDTAATLYGLN